MSMWVKWIGQRPRENAFGVFEPNLPIEVPNHIGAQLLRNERFVELTEAERALIAGASDGDLRRRLQMAADELSAAAAQIQTLAAANADMEARLAAYQEAEARGPAPTAEELQEGEETTGGEGIGEGA